MRLAHVVCFLIVAGSATALPANDPKLTDLLIAPASPQLDIRGLRDVTPVAAPQPPAIPLPTRVVPKTNARKVPSPVMDRKSVDTTVSRRRIPAKPMLAELHMMPAETERPVATTSTSEEVQFESDVPRVSIRTVGPDTLYVGKSARYTITLTNRSNFEASNLNVRCVVPSWVVVDSHSVSMGAVIQQQTEIIWNVERMSARGDQQLLLDLIPRSGQAFELDVDVSVSPKHAKKRIAIKEPKLDVSVQGPSEIIYGSPSTWQIEINNPGTGDAENVVLDVMSETQRIATQNVGTLVAGGRRIAMLELSAFDVGHNKLHIKATGSPGLNHSADRSFLVRRGQLAVSLAGPSQEYAGTNGTYEAVIRNLGDAPLKNVLMSLSIPPGMKYLAGLETCTLTADGVTWIVPQVNASQVLGFPLEIGIDSGGMHELRVSANTVDSQSADAHTLTEAMTIADLKLEVTDPRGPRPLGGLDEYEIQVTNQGTAMAREIRIIALCAPEVELVDVDGNAVIKSGQIFFKPIELAANHKVAYKVKVRANKPGTHAFRVVVVGQDPDLRLAAEESTRFFDRSGRIAVPEVITKDSDVEEAAALRQPQAISQRDI